MMLLNLIFSIFNNQFLVQILVTLIVFLILRLARFLQIRHRRYQLFRHYGIRGPEPSMIDGSLSNYRKGVSVIDVEEKNFKEYGKIYGKYVGDAPIITIIDLDILKVIFLDDENKAFTERDFHLIVLPVVTSILFAKYPRWKVMRKALSQPFKRFAMRGQSSTVFLEKSVRSLLDYIEQKINRNAKVSNKNCATIDIHDLMKATTLDVISGMAVNIPDVQVKEGEENVQSLDSYLARSYEGIIDLVIICPLLGPIVQSIARYNEVNKTLAKIHFAISNLIDEKLKKLARDTKYNIDEKQSQVMDIITKLHLEGKLTRDEVTGNAEAILFAGYETTSTTLTYIFWVLAKYPDIQKKLRSDLMAYGVESKYLLQVINETMRLYPTVVGFTTRIATKSVKIKDLIIPQGSKVTFNNWLVHRNPDYWPNPEEFNTERFREGIDIHPCAFAPFGLGAKMCLGYQLALLEMKVITCDILLRYELILKQPQNLKLISFGQVLSAPKEKVILEFRSLQ